MNDAQVRRAQWLPLVAGFFVPKLGGTPEAWKAANSQVMSRLQDERAWQARLRESRDYASFDRQYKIDWLRGMCELAGVPSPVDEDCVSLAQAAYKYIAPRKRAAFAGVA